MNVVEMPSIVRSTKSSFVFLAKLFLIHHLMNWYWQNQNLPKS